MRTWQLTVTYAGQTKLDVIAFPYQRQAYGFAIDWFVDDLAVEALELIDEAGHADTLTLKRRANA